MRTLAENLYRRIRSRSDGVDPRAQTKDRMIVVVVGMVAHLLRRPTLEPKGAQGAVWAQQLLPRI